MVAVGASFTGVTSRVMVLAGLELRVPSPTVKVKLPWPAPLASGTGLKTSLPRSISATVMGVPRDTGAPLNFKSPAPAVLAMVTDCRLSPVSTSAKLKSAALKT